MNSKSKLLKFKRLNGIATEIPCTEKETAEIKARIAANLPLPSDVYFKQSAGEGYFYRHSSEGRIATLEESSELIHFLQLERLTSIRNWLIGTAVLSFLTLLAVIIF